MVDWGELGTITKRQGRFELVLPSLPAVLMVRFVGFETRRVAIGPNDSRDVTVDLVPAVYTLDELVITGADFAENVMRKVILRKQVRREHLTSYKARGYTRITLENRDQIVLVSERVFDSYWSRGRGRQDIVRSRRETGDFYRDLGLDHTVVDFSADYVELPSQRFIGPTHPDALKHYSFTFAGHRKLDQTLVYDIFVAPKTGLEATFVGQVSVMDSTYALVVADLRPARHVVWPAPIQAWEVFYRQQFVAVDSLWLPLDLRLEGWITAGKMPVRAALHQVSQLSGYRLNEGLPVELVQSRVRVLIDSASVFQDDLFLLGRGLVALTPAEVVALETLQRGEQTLLSVLPLVGKPLRPSLPWDAPQFTWPVIMGQEPWLRFNRADGYLVGAGRTLEVGDRLWVRGRVAKSIGGGRTHFGTQATRRWGRRFAAAAGYGHDTEPQWSSPIMTPALNSLHAVLGGRDYFDYLWARKGIARVGYVYRGLRFSATGHLETHESVEATRFRAWPFRIELGPNSPVTEDMVHSVALAAVAGDAYTPFRFGPLHRIGIEFERGRLRWPYADRAYTRATVQVDGYAKTFLRQRPKPHGLAIRLFATTSYGTLPAQRRAAVDGAPGPVSSFGMLRGLKGRSYVDGKLWALFWEHDFQTSLFEAVGLKTLVDRGTGVRLSGARVAADGTHHELTFSFSEIWGSPLRVDVTYRLDRPGLYVGVGLSRLF